MPAPKIIFISIPWFLPAYKAGGPVQSIANMVDALKDEYLFYIFCGDADLNEEPITVAANNKWLPFNINTQVFYATPGSRNRQMLQQVKALQPDILYLVGIYSWPFTWWPLFFAAAPLKIISVRGMLHPGALGEKSLKKKIFLHVLQWLGVASKCRWQATDDQEAGYISKQLGAKAVVRVASNFPRKIEPLPLPLKVSGSLRLISIALISPMKNILLVIQSLKGMTARIEYDIYGPVKERPYWDQCLQAIQALPDQISVHYHGEINPIDVPQKLSASQVFILPSKSENFGHAIYEAMSAGLPVITSRYTLWNGLQTANAGLNVDTDIASLRQAIERYAAMNEDEFCAQQIAVKQYAEDQMNLSTLKEAYVQLFTK